MWPYHEITREEFEKIKDHIEEIMIAHGGFILFRGETLSGNIADTTEDKKAPSGAFSCLKIVG